MRGGHNHGGHKKRVTTEHLQEELMELKEQNELMRKEDTKHEIIRMKRGNSDELLRESQPWK
ncbi:hypothetical protein [Paenibacillus sp. URB8-2]|uniref:hypothetical protein n=1 Tax=Paenibacillus sp. URB8-2 TaxID=2741301 RepID=UPI0015BC3FE7|nr:hypothetical protein [Paenibacillus sp. URB8-2]BCG60922.1 hypothetical protein PUR_43470 [Paenibacillus sp. URB8-2]